MKIAVIVEDHGAAANAGGEVERKFKLFDLPNEIADYVLKNQGTWRTISFMLEDTVL